MCSGPASDLLHFRALFQAKLVDDRSDDEDEGEPDEAEHDKDD